MPDWREELHGFLGKTEISNRAVQEVSQMNRFIDHRVIPAFESLAKELDKHGRRTTIRNSGTSAAIIVHFDGQEEITYRIQSRSLPDRIVPYADIRVRQRKGLRMIRVESAFRSNAEGYSLEDITQEEIIRNFLANYMQRVRRE